MQQALIVGERIPAERVLEAREAAGAMPRSWSPEVVPDAHPDGSSGGLAHCLVELEHEMERDRPAEVVIADDSDAGLAATIVAAKLLIGVEAADQALGTGTVNARLISRLTATYTPQG